MTDLAVPPRFLEDVYQAASECNKCSLCQAVCPTYVTNPVEWETARGRVSLIRDAIEGRLELRDIAEGPLSTCLTCDNCVAACAPRVPTALIVSRARMELHEQEGHPPGQSFAFRSILPRPGRLRFLHRLSRAAQVTGLHALARRTGVTRWLGPAGALMEHVGPLPRHTAYKRARSLPEVTQPVRGRVGFLMCCYQNLAMPQATEATMRVLLANGFEVEVPQLACSGLPAKSLGDREAMTSMAVASVDVLRDLKVDMLAGDVASCTAHYKQYDTILAADPTHAVDAQRVAQRTVLATELLADAGQRAELGPLRWRVAIDEPCSLPIDGTTRSAARQLLADVPRLEIVPLGEAAMCCGGPGMYFHEQPERSRSILERKFEHVVASGAEVLVTENVSCLVQLRNGAARYAPGVRVMHVFEVLSESMQTAQRRSAILPE
ncbi:MAG: (Fe-S)-binding protein [Candidatus Dormibacteraeota bacterium]|uniref:Glycolate oxidase iron-sulfur subunit n=1 Tax=Candidatus Amunia macphersoniae TaxID=3127014 RepID=A0A934KNC6_9BACT|nr:(Fe-S)-binding protein [Candidatus Dormibacteraeota bacterium]